MPQVSLKRCDKNSICKQDFKEASSLRNEIHNFFTTLRYEFDTDELMCSSCVQAIIHSDTCMFSSERPNNESNIFFLFLKIKGCLSILTFSLAVFSLVWNNNLLEVIEISFDLQKVNNQTNHVHDSHAHFVTNAAKKMETCLPVIALFIYAIKGGEIVVSVTYSSKSVASIIFILELCIGRLTQV